jgi:hypothetical protein
MLYPKKIINDYSCGDFQLVSDLHIEQYYPKSPNPSDLFDKTSNVLIIAGDIGSIYQLKQFSEFIYKCSKLYKYVIFILGNHDYYIPWDEENSTIGLDISYMKQRVKIVEELISNVIFLDREYIILNGLFISGCTLWSDISGKLEVDSATYLKRVRIHNMTIELYNEMHQVDLKFIKDIVFFCESLGVKLLVITHHCPTFQEVLGTRYGGLNNPYKNLYATDCQELLSTSRTPIKSWICGHTHHNFDFYTDNGIRVLSNQKGKRYEVTNFNRSKTINLNLNITNTNTQQKLNQTPIVRKIINKDVIKYINNYINTISVF